MFQKLRNRETTYFGNISDAQAPGLKNLPAHQRCKLRTEIQKALSSPKKQKTKPQHPSDDFKEVILQENPRKNDPGLPILKFSPKLPTTPLSPAEIFTTSNLSLLP